MAYGQVINGSCRYDGKTLSLQIWVNKDGATLLTGLNATAVLMEPDGSAPISGGTFTEVGNPDNYGVFTFEPLNLNGLANGQYYIRVSIDDGSITLDDRIPLLTFGPQN